MEGRRINLRKTAAYLEGLGFPELADRMRQVDDEIEAKKEKKKGKIILGWNFSCPDCDSGFTLSPYRNLEQREQEQQSLAAMVELGELLKRGMLQIWEHPNHPDKKKRFEVALTFKGKPLTFGHGETLPAAILAIEEDS